MAIIGTLSEWFLDGVNDTDFATDWNFLTDAEQDVIIDFIKEINELPDVIGKNKESWLTDFRVKIPGTDGYEDSEYWHYHCGPSWWHHTFGNRTTCLIFNPRGKASQECIHYYPVTPNEIIVVGFSRNHIPFLLSDDPRNPFFS